MLAPILLLLAAAPASITNTATVHDLAAFEGQVVACTEGGLEVFSPRGDHLRTLHREDGLPSHFCRALRTAHHHLLAATDEGVAILDARLHVTGVLPFRWSALPTIGSTRALKAYAARLESGPTYTAFSEGFAGTADGRVFRLSDGRVWSVPGPVRVLDESGEGLRIGTSEGRYLLTRAGLSVQPPLGAGTLAYSGAGRDAQVITSEGARFRWSGEPLLDDAPHDTSSWLEAFGRTWAGTADGVFTLEEDGWVRRTPEHQVCGNHITAIARFHGRLAVGTFDQGMCWQDAAGHWTAVRAPALPSNHVLALADDGKRFYVATEYGVGMWDGRRWRQLASSGHNPLRFGRLSVLAEAELGRGEVAFADGRGVSFAVKGRFKQRIALPSDWAKHPSVSSVSGPFVWYGSEDRGLARFDGAAWTHFHDGRELTDNWITAIDSDAAGRAIAGTCQNGFNYFDGQGWTRVTEGLPSGDVTAVALTPGGAVVGTLLGAVRFNAKSGKVSPLSAGADPRVSAIRVEADRIWLGTEGGLTEVPVMPAPSSGPETRS